MNPVKRRFQDFKRVSLQVAATILNSSDQYEVSWSGMRDENGSTLIKSEPFATRDDSFNAK